MGDMYQNVNIYDNFLVIFGKNFISPIADGGKTWYDYYLTDSAFIGKEWCYKLEFGPSACRSWPSRRSRINDTTYAVRKAEAGSPRGQPELRAGLLGKAGVRAGGERSGC